MSLISSKLKTNPELISDEELDKIAEEFVAKRIKNNDPGLRASLIKWGTIIFKHAFKQGARLEEIAI